MPNKTYIETLKNKVSILDYLESKQVDCVSTLKKNFCFFSPITGETGTPSFFVTNDGTGFNCFSSGNKGDIYRLVMILEKMDFMQSYNFLSKFDSSIISPLVIDKMKPEIKAEIEINEVKELQNYNLINYAKERCISLEVLQTYCKEVHYTSNKRPYYGIGFKNNLGGYEIRNKNFKGCIGRKSWSLLGNVKSETVIVFEGFFDFLSMREYSQQNLINNQAFVVLNSLTLWNDFYQQKGHQFNKFLLHLDNDTAGKKLTQKLLLQNDEKFIDCSWLYVAFNDFNEFLIDTCMSV